MFSPRNIEDIQNDFINTIIQSGSDFSLDVSQGSFIYTLARAAAAVSYQQDEMLSTLYSSSSLLEAKGSNLEAFGLSFGIVRKSAEASEGYVILTSPFSVVIRPNTVLTHLSTSLQFYTLNQANITVAPNVETVVRIRALEVGSDSNLSAGTNLYADDYSSTKFVIAYKRENEYIGDLTGGNDEESDEAYRYRIAQVLGSSSTSSENYLLQKLLEYPLVERGFVRTKVGGFVEIWVDASTNYTQSQKDELIAYIKPHVNAGIVPIIIQAERIRVDIELYIEPFRNTTTNLEDLTRQVSSSVKSYIQNLAIGEGISISSLVEKISPIARKINVNQPPKDVIVSLNQIIVLGNLKITYPTVL
jgi:uncharacterized phage protein gp47/JayE